MSCYFINYKIFVNIVKYKLDLMRKRMEVEERDATSRSSFRCTTCNKQFSDLEADQLFDMISQVDTGCHGLFAGRELLPPAHGHVLTGKVDTCCHGLFAGRELLPPALRHDLTGRELLPRALRR